MSEPIEPPIVRVHLAGSDVPFGRRRAERRLTTFTKVITAAAPVADLLPYDPGRIIARVQALDNDVIVTTSFGEAQDVANTTVGQPFANGLVVAKANPFPWPLDGAQRMWATAAAYPARITVAVVHESR